MNDRELVARMGRGDERAFDEFFEQNYDRLFRFAARRLRDTAAAEDVAQAALVHGIRKLHTWRGEAALFTWLCAICRRELLAHWTRTRTEPARACEDDPLTAAVLDQIAAAGDDPERAAERRELADRIQATLDHLPGRYADVLTWKYLDGHSVTAIAARLDLSPKAVESMLTRARDAFRQGFASLPMTPEAP